MNQQIDTIILTILKESGQYLVPEETLKSTVRLRITPRPLHSDIRQRIEYLDSKERITAVNGEYGRKFKISELGEAWLKENA